MEHSQGDFFNITTNFAFVSLLPYVKTKNTGETQALSLAEVRYGYHRPTKNVFKTQENEHLCYSSENIIFPVFLRRQLVKDLTLLCEGGRGGGG